MAWLLHDRIRTPAVWTGSATVARRLQRQPWQQTPSRTGTVVTRSPMTWNDTGVSGCSNIATVKTPRAQPHAGVVLAGPTSQTNATPRRADESCSGPQT